MNQHFNRQIFRYWRPLAALTLLVTIGLHTLRSGRSAHDSASPGSHSAGSRHTHGHNQLSTAVYRQDVFFRAKVVAIRPVQNHDNVIGASGRPFSHVALLHISRIDKGSDIRIVSGRIVASPIHEGRVMWARYLSQGSDIRFLLSVFGKREFVSNFGC